MGGKLRRELRVKRGLVVTLVLDDRLLHDFIRFRDQSQSFGSGCVIESVGNFPQAIQILFNRTIAIRAVFARFGQGAAVLADFKRLSGEG